jgi:hypothetical protein
VHLRNHLYIPLEACKPTTKGDHIVRGPGSGQVTIVPRRRRASANGTRPEGGDQTSEPSWGSSSANGIFDGHRPGTPDTIKAGSGSNGIGASDEPDEQILDIVRLPASQLRFFPRGKRETPRSRTSLDGDIGKSADSVRSLNAVERARRREARERDREVSGGAGAAARAAVFAPLGALSAAAGAVAQPRKNVVRLRPPQAPTPTDDSFAGQLRSLFSVPPPPVPVSRSASARVPPAHVRTESADSASDSARLAHAHMRVEVEMEMDARPWSGASTPPRTLRKTDKKRD